MKIFTQQDAAEIIAQDGVMFAARARCLIEPVQRTAAYGGSGMAEHQVEYLFEVMLEQAGEALHSACYSASAIDLFTAEARMTFYAKTAPEAKMNGWRDESDRAFSDLANGRQAA